MTKIDVISGFLGAGKTTLIQKLIKDVFAGQKVVLVENEFGEIGIDGGFLQEAGIEITEINSGCICCTLKGDFEAALKKVSEEYQPDHIIIEPSGVGKLSDILRAIRDVDGLELNSYSTVVDAKRCQIYHKNFKEFFDDQIATASCVILSRTQMTDEATLQKDLDIIRELNSDVRVITTPWDELSGTAIFEAMEGSSSGFPEISYDEDDEDEDEHEHHHHHDDDEEEHEHHHHHDDDEDEELHGHHHHHHHHEHDHEHAEVVVDEKGNRIYKSHSHEHEHHHHHHHGGHDADEVFGSWGMETPARFTQEEITGILQKLEDGKTYGTILRSKGIVPAADGQWIHFDYVPGETQVRFGAAEVTGKICVIGAELKEDALADLFAK